MHMFVSYDRVYSDAGIGFGLVVCRLSNCLRQRNPDNNYYYQHGARWLCQSQARCIYITNLEANEALVFS